MIIQYIQEPTRNEKISVGTSSVTVAQARNAANPRKVISIRNTSTDAADIITVHLGGEGTPTAGAGIVLQKNEGYTDSSESGYNCWQGTIRAICATANGEIAVFER